MSLSKAIYTIFMLLMTFNLFGENDPFEWHADYAKKSGSLIVSVKIAPHHYLYKETTKIKVTSDGKIFKFISEPESADYKDTLGDHKIYLGPSMKKWIYALPPASSCNIVVEFQGCRHKTENKPAMCLFPSKKNFSFNPVKVEKNSSLDINEGKETIDLKSKKIQKKETDQNKKIQNPEIQNSLEALLDKFEVENSDGGYMSVERFMQFLNSGKNATSANSNSRFGNMPVKSLMGLILFIIFGGIMLNLTPCVLPMIPINLGIIGAGSANNSKSSGFMRGGIYGIGIAAAYGSLGVITVLTGAKFGTLNSSPVFNYIIGTLFIVLAFGMFDVISIDFSKYSAFFKLGKKEGISKIGELIGVFAMGVIAALLAGACVAPVVIAVLLYSATVYAAGNPAGILLPFLLGIGMALPWPFAGAGIAVLPKPGRWMMKVKYLFGFLILIFAGYYIYTGVALSKNDDMKTYVSSIKNFESRLIQAEKEEKPVFIDFWATWCKNCLQMETSTFKNPTVKKRLEDFVVVKFQAENIKDENIIKLLDRFNLQGLPGYVILYPKKNPDCSRNLTPNKDF